MGFTRLAAAALTEWAQNDGYDVLTEEFVTTVLVYADPDTGSTLTIEFDLYERDAGVPLVYVTRLDAEGRATTLAKFPVHPDMPVSAARAALQCAQTYAVALAELGR